MIVLRYKGQQSRVTTIVKLGIDWVDYRRGNHHIAEEEKCTITPGNDGFDVDDTIASFLGLIVS